MISKLEDKIIFMEKTAKEMKEDQISYLREMSDLRKAHEEKVMELKCRFVIKLLLEMEVVFLQAMIRKQSYCIMFT